MIYKYNEFSFNLKDKMTFGSREGVEGPTSILTALREVPFSSIFYSSRPLAFTLTRRRTQAFFFIIAILCITKKATPDRVSGEVAVTSNRVRFSVLANRNENIAFFSTPFFASSLTNTKHLSIPNRKVTVEKIGLLYNDQNISREEQLLYIEGSSIILDFPKPVRWNSWYFVTSNQSPDSDPVRFMVESHANGEWRTVSSSTEIPVLGGVVFMNGYYATTTERGGIEKFDLFVREPIKITLQTILLNLVAGTIYLLISMAGLCGVEHLAVELAKLRAACGVAVNLLHLGLLVNHRSPAWDCEAVQAPYILIEFVLLRCAAREQWVRFLFFTSLRLTLMALMLYGRPFYGAKSPAQQLLELGVPGLIVAPLLLAFQWCAPTAGRRERARRGGLRIR